MLYIMYDILYEVSILFSTMDFSICYNLPTGSGVQPASYPIRTWGCMPDGGSVAAEAWSCPFTSV